MTCVAETYAALARELEAALVEGELAHDEPMAEHTTFKVGGPADLFARPANEDEFVACVRACRAHGAEFFVLGCGSDLLVGDAGFRGVVIDCAEALTDILLVGDPRKTCRLVCQAGAPIIEASQFATSLALTGLEFACGIPGSVGGAVFMNAGAYDGCCANVLESARCLMPDGSVRELSAAELALGYRTSRVKTEGLVVLSATFVLEPGDAETIAARVAELTSARESKQPLELPSAGSTFKRPEGHFAGKLITDAGLKGYRVGGAAVSEKHAGFVVNLGGATAADVRAVIAHVQSEVRRQFSVELEPEVHFLGSF